MLRCLFPLLTVSVLAPGASLAGTPSPASPASALEGLGSLEIRDPKLTLVQAGAEPRSVVRFHPRPGATATYEVVSRSKMEMSIAGPDGTPMSVPLGNSIPAAIVKTRNTVGKPVANGLVPIRVEQLDVRIEGGDPAVAGPMRDELAKMKGTALQLFVDPDGRLVQTDVSGSDPAMTEMMQGLADQISNQLPSFPSEPIGRGAVWTTELGMSVSGLDLAATQTCTVSAVSADAITLDIQLKMRAREGEMQVPGLPPGASIDLGKLAGAGHGTMKYDLGTLTGLGTMEMDIDMAMNAGVPGQGSMAMTMKMHQSTETRAAR